MQNYVHPIWKERMKTRKRPHSGRQSCGAKNKKEKRKGISQCAFVSLDCNHGFSFIVYGQE